MAVCLLLFVCISEQVAQSRRPLPEIGLKRNGFFMGKLYPPRDRHSANGAGLAAVTRLARSNAAKCFR